MSEAGDDAAMDDLFDAELFVLDTPTTVDEARKHLQMTPLTSSTFGDALETQLSTDSMVHRSTRTCSRRGPRRRSSPKSDPGRKR